MCDGGVHERLPLDVKWVPLSLMTLRFFYTPQQFVK